MNPDHAANTTAGMPVHHTDVAAFPLDDEIVLYAPSDAQAYVLNGTAAYIWGLCDGTRTTEAIAEALAEHFELDYTQALHDARNLIHDLECAGLLASA